MKNSGTQMSRRRFLEQLATAAGATILAGCGSSAPSTTQTSATQASSAESSGTTPTQPVAAGPAPAGENAEIVFINWDAIEGTPYEAAIKEFEKQTSKKVKVLPTPSDQYETKIRSMLAAGTPPDVMRINDDFVRGYSVDNLLLDLTPYINESKVNPDDYFAPIYDFAKQPDGKYTAWAIGNAPRLIYYNIDMFKQAGAPLPPTTWTDEGWKWDYFLARAKQLTKEGERWGALIYDDTGVEQTFAVNNGDADGIWSKDGKKFTLADPKGAEAIQWAADLTCKEHVQPERSLLTQSDAGNQLFVSGKIGMIFRTFGVVPYMRKNAKDFTWDVAPVPGKVEQKTEGSLVVFTAPRITRNPEGAWQLLQFLGGPVGSKIFADSGAFVPALKETAATIKHTSEPPEHIELFVEAMNHNTATNFTENTERGRQILPAATRSGLDLSITGAGCP